MIPVPHDPLPRYLEPTEEVDFLHPDIQTFLGRSCWRDLEPVAQAERVFLFVRDEIRHSFDAQHEIITCAASEVLRHRTGLCYAKSHLAAALLRSLGVPTGLCYQRLILFDDPQDGYCLHGLIAVWLGERWIRLDARGNKPGIDAQFLLTEERLAFPVRAELGEIDYPGVYATANPNVVKSLRHAPDAPTLYTFGLPSDLSVGS